MEIGRNYKNIDSALDLKEYYVDFDCKIKCEPLAIRIYFESFEKLQNDLIKLENIKCKNIILENYNLNDLEQIVKMIRNYKFLNISITKQDDENVLELLKKYNLNYYIFAEKNNFIDEIKRYKKYLLFIILNDIDDYGFNTLALSNINVYNSILYLVNKNIDTNIIINTDLFDYVNLRNNYFDNKITKKLMPSKFNKSVKLFNYKISSNQKLSFEEIIKIENNYVSYIINKNKKSS